MKVKILKKRNSKNKKNSKKEILKRREILMGSEKRKRKKGSEYCIVCVGGGADLDGKHVRACGGMGCGWSFTIFFQTSLNDPSSFFIFKNNKMFQTHIFSLKCPYNVHTILINLTSSF